MRGSLHKTINRLSDLSTVIQRMRLETKIDDSPVEGHMLNFANSERVLREIASTAEALAADLGMSLTDVETLLVPLFKSGTFYGSYHELRIYGWLLKNGVRFTAQPALDGTRVINPNGSTLDGRIDDIDLYFDIKSFGFQYRAKEDFRQKLSRLLKSQVVINGPMDVPIADLAQYTFPRVEAITEDLRSTGASHVPELHWDIRTNSGRRVTIETTTTDPYRLAEENRHYALNFSKQFTRLEPFMLIFGFGHEFNGSLHVNFANHADILFRSMARRFFMELANDVRDASELPNGFSNQLAKASVSDVAKLLSGVLFVSLDEETCWLFTNPNATNPMTDYHVEQMFDFQPPHRMSLDDFAHDNY